MLFLLSPAKALDYNTPAPAGLAISEPSFIAQAAELIATLKTLSSSEVGQLMSLSAKLSELNAQRFQAWRSQPAPDMVKAAILAFDGDVYEGLDAKSLSIDSLQWLNQHARILSGLYGVLRPLDALQAYRLEMSTKFGVGAASNLYQYWKTHIASHLNHVMAELGHQHLINLASGEYFKAVHLPSLQYPVIDCRFEDEKDGQYKIISFYAKRARGLMLRWALEQQATQPADLQGFDAEGYAFAPQCSSETLLVFRRSASSSS